AQRRAGPPRRRRHLGPALLRGTRPAPSAREDLRATPLPRIGSLAHRCHPAPARRRVLARRAEGLHGLTGRRAPRLAAARPAQARRTRRPHSANAAPPRNRTTRPQRPSPPARPPITRWSARTTTSSNAPPPPPPPPPASPASRSTKPTRTSSSRSALVSRPTGVEDPGSPEARPRRLNANRVSARLVPP